MATKRKYLSLEQKLKAIELMEKGSPAYKVAEEFGVGKTQIQNLRKRKYEVLDDIEKNVPMETKRRRHATGNENINELTYEWFKDAVSRRIPVTGPLIQTKALQFAEQLNIIDFKASKGWLQSFIKRNNVTFGSMSGERGDVKSETVNDWKKKLPKLCEGYAQKDIFNMDESGLFFRDTTRKTIHFKTDDCAGGKRSKERITISLCASMTGEKMKLLVIGKSRSPRCFGKIDKKKLPVHYNHNNQKAWMTSWIYEDYLRTLNRQMRAEQRHILLFVDNAPCHPELVFSHMKVIFLPPNTTSCTQPMDQGIIQTTKLKFRKRQLLHLVKEMERQPAATGTDLLKQINILDAIYWIKNSWTEVEESTIQKCFVKSGFGVSNHESNEIENRLSSDPSESDPDIVDNGDDDNDDDDDDDDVPLAAMKLAQELFGCSFKELSTIDQEINAYETNVVDWNLQANEILDNLKSNDCVNQDLSDDDDDDDEILSENEHVTINEANDMVHKLKAFAVRSGNPELLESLQNVDEKLTEMSVKKSKQTKIDDFFLNTSRPI